ncbi:hypothetical protein ABZ863_26775 [Saccharomonospora sp. NPDC046836]|uniref:hypothetical protein n=1 Tax=Saccharomonospora sp. NPDC046836 TaxID=3156921 RepID=UPI0033EE52D3
MRKDEVNPTEPDHRLPPDVPAPSHRDIGWDTEEIPEPPNKDEVRPDEVDPQTAALEQPPG